MKITAFVSVSLLALNMMACSDDSSGSKDGPAPVAEQGPIGEGDAGAGNTPPAPGAGDGATVTPPTGETGTGTTPPTGETGTGVVEAPVGGGTPVVVPFTPSAVTTVEINASDYDNWLHYDLDTGKVVTATDATWDLAFKRTAIKLNTGVQGLNLKDTVFDSVTAAPAGAYIADAHVEGTPDTEGRFFHVPEAWYTYDITVHVIAVRNWTYVVKTNGGHDVKLTFTDYYNFDRESGFPQLKSQLIGRF